MQHVSRYYLVFRLEKFSVNENQCSVEIQTPQYPDIYIYVQRIAPFYRNCGVTEQNKKGKKERKKEKLPKYRSRWKR